MYKRQIGGGTQNKTEAIHNFIGGGFQNTGSVCGGFIGGGNNNRLSLNSFTLLKGSDSVIVGGRQNQICHLTDGCNSNFIGGGSSNLICNYVGKNTIVGGQSNLIHDANASFIGGGFTNQMQYSNHSSLLGGCNNCLCLTRHSTLGGGLLNCISDSCCSTIAGGVSNSITETSKCSTIGGGTTNRIIRSNSATISGGCCNKIGSSTSVGGNNFIGGGCCNTMIYGCNSFIGGGDRNCIIGTGANLGSCNGILGGTLNKICSPYQRTFIIGSNITATANCTTFMNNTVITGSLTVGNSSQLSTTLGRIDAKNDVVAFSTSDRRLKENIQPILHAVEKIERINGVSFDWKELNQEEIKTIHGNKGHDVGVIAQEIEKIIPEAVTTRDSGYKAVNYEKIIPLLIEAIKDQQKQIDELKRKI